MNFAQRFPFADTPVAQLIGEHDWASTPLGPMCDWPAGLRVTVDTMLLAPTPKFLAWSDELCLVYNDAYLKILGSKHPASLGKPLRMVWAEVWSDVEHLVRRALNGEAFYLENVPFKLERDNGKLSWISFSYTPLYANGAVAGILCDLYETTQRVNDESARAEENRRLHALFDQSPGMVAIVHGPEHVFVSNNANYDAFVGGRALIGKRAKDALPELEQQGFIALLDAVYQTGEVYKGEAVPVSMMRNNAAELHYVNFVYQPLRGEHGDIEGIFVEGFDVTPLVQGVSALRESERLFHQLANTIPQLAWMADATGSIHWYNDRWYDYTGTVESDMTGWGWQSVHDPKVLPAAMAAWTASVESGTPFEMTFPIKGSDGRYRPFLTKVAPLKDHTGKIVQWFGSNTDVTSLHAAQEALQKTEQWLADGLAAGRMVVWEWDLESGQVKYSENALAVLGYGNADAAKGWASVHPDDRERLDEIVKQAIAQCGTFSATTRRIRPDNGRLIWVESKGRVLATDDGKPWAVRGIMIDQTSRVEAEHELTEASRRKDEFLAMLAHELRNPLAPISTAAQLLQMSVQGNPQATRAGEIIVRQVRHMTELVDDLLDVSRVTRGLVQLDTEVIDLKTVLAAAVEQARPLIELRAHILQTRVAASSAWVVGDRTRLIQVLSNLLNNAAKYTQHHGQISVAVDVAGDSAVITVSDNGSGIDPGLLPHIFDLFSQAERTPDRSQGGLGLGLALVKSIVTLHGGTVTAGSPGRGKGTTVEVSLPLSVQAPAALATAEIAMPSATQRPLRVVIVDDNEDAADLLAALMGACGHQAAVYFDAETALSSQFDDPIDVFILDIGLPRIDGHELARRLRADARHGGAILIALTGYGQAHDEVLSKAAGFDFHLVKPVDFTRLTGILQSIK